MTLKSTMIIHKSIHGGQVARHEFIHIHKRGQTNKEQIYKTIELCIRKSKSMQQILQVFALSIERYPAVDTLELNSEFAFLPRVRRPW